MGPSRRFKALFKIAGLFSSLWAALGVLVGLLGAGTTPSTILTYGIMYGAVGGISGIVTALLVARAESGRSIQEVRTWRVAGWGIAGGIAPAALFSALGLAFGAPASALLPLLGLGVVGGGLGGIVSGSASVAAKRAALADGDTPPELPAP